MYYFNYDDDDCGRVLCNARVSDLIIFINFKKRFRGFCLVNSIQKVQDEQQQEVTVYFQ